MISSRMVKTVEILGEVPKNQHTKAISSIKLKSKKRTLSEEYDISNCTPYGCSNSFPNARSCKPMQVIS